MEQNENTPIFMIGNDLQVRWPILTNGEEISLSGRNLSLYLSDQWGNTSEVFNFDTIGNEIVFTFSGADQEKTGVYRLLLYENEGGNHQHCVDYCYAFRLVSHGHDLPDDIREGEVTTGNKNMTVGVPGLSAYELAVRFGYDGTEEEWVADLASVKAIISGEGNRINAELERERSESLRQEAESGRVDAERGRVEAEALRQSSEDERQAHDTSYTLSEERRVSAENQREESFSAALNRLETAINDWNLSRKVMQTESVVEIQPNVKNIWATPISELTVTFAAGVQGYDNEYMIEFTCPSNAATVLSLPSGLLWANDDPLEPTKGWTYQISVIDNLAVYAGWESIS